MLPLILFEVSITQSLCGRITSLVPGRGWMYRRAHSTPDAPHAWPRPFKAWQGPQLSRKAGLSWWCLAASATADWKSMLCEQDPSLVGRMILKPSF